MSVIKHFICTVSGPWRAPSRPAPPCRWASCVSAATSLSNSTLASTSWTASPSRSSSVRPRPRSRHHHTTLKGYVPCLWSYRGTVVRVWYFPVVFPFSSTGHCDTEQANRKRQCRRSGRGNFIRVCAFKSHSRTYCCVDLRSVFDRRRLWRVSRTASRASPSLLPGRLAHLFTRVYLKISWDNPVVSLNWDLSCVVGWCPQKALTASRWSARPRTEEPWRTWAAG